MLKQVRPDTGVTLFRFRLAAGGLLALNLLPGCLFSLTFPEGDISTSSGETSLSSADLSSSGDASNSTTDSAESTGDSESAPASGTTLDDTTGGTSTTTGGSSGSSGPGDTDTTGTPIMCPPDSDCTPGTPRCPESCYRDRFAFVTSVTIKGYDIGGTDEADELCNKLAVDAGLFTQDQAYKHPMRAWLSDVSDDAKGPVNFGRGRYFLPRTAQERQDGVPADDASLLIADSFEAILLPSMTRPINRDELGFEHAGYAWTNTNLQGTAISQEPKGTCNHWKTSCCVNCPCEGLVGNIAAVDGKWTTLSPPVNYSYCGDDNPLYCFESLWDAIP